jgi:hypothetical protein
MTDNDALEWLKTNAAQFYPPELRGIPSGVAILSSSYRGDDVNFELSDGRDILCKRRGYESPSK